MWRTVYGTKERKTKKNVSNLSKCCQISDNNNEDDDDDDDN
jgi:hypothetical protein